MSNTFYESRTAYHPCGKVNWLRFIPGLVVAGSAAVAMAGCLFVAFQSGFYLVFLAPLVASFAAGGIWSLVLKWSDCRNQKVAAGASCVLALLLYFS